MTWLAHFDWLNTKVVLCYCDNGYVPINQSK